jgi:hypothetical protein
MALLTGCVGIIPVPSSSKVPEVGQVIKPDAAGFIRPGQTSREQVVERLGQDFRASPRLPVLAYSWDLPGGRALWWWCVAWGEVAAGDAGEFEWSHWRAFFVAFNEIGVVTRTQFVRLSGRKSLDEQLEAWGMKAVAKAKTASQRPAAVGELQGKSRKVRGASA